MAGAIWRINADGRQITRITSWSVIDPESPAWSPDGTRVVFAARTSGGRFDIYVKRLHNSRPRRLTSGSHVDERPSWSPDGKRLAFGRSLLVGGSLQRSELCVMNADGSHERRIGVGSNPDWSPGGKRLAYTRGEEIWVSNTDGRMSFPLISGPGMAGGPAWSPDGHWIVFWSDQASGEATKGDLYLVTADGELVQRLTFEPDLWHFAPSWQPASKRRR
jgi:Tol biopolymer transport system component